MKHLDANTVAAFSARTLSVRERSGVFEHLADCPACREWIAVHAQLQTRQPARPIWKPLSVIAAACAACVSLTLWIMRPAIEPLPTVMQSQVVALPEFPATTAAQAQVTVMEQRLPAWTHFTLASRTMAARPADQVSVMTTVGERWIPAHILHRETSDAPFSKRYPTLQAGYLLRP